MKSILESGKKPGWLSRETALRARVARAFGIKNSEITSDQIGRVVAAAVDNLEKLGTPGNGVRFMDSSSTPPEISLSTDALAFVAPPQLPKYQNNVYFTNRYFQRPHGRPQGAAILHELNHLVSGLGDGVQAPGPAGLPGATRTRANAAFKTGFESTFYHWNGIESFQKFGYSGDGSSVNDVMVCSMGGC